MKKEEIRTEIRTHKRRAIMAKSGYEAFEIFMKMLADLWNACLQERRDAWRLAKKSVGKFDQIKSFTLIRAENPEWKQFGMRPVQRLIMRVDDAYQRFFKGTAKYPRYKTENRGIRSFEVPKDGFRLRPSGRRWKILLQGFPVIKFDGDLPEGEIKMLRLVKTAIGIDLQFVMEEKVHVKPTDAPLAAGDLGITNQIFMSNGLAFKKLERNRDKEKHFQRKAASKVRGSKSQKKEYASARKAAHRENVRLVNICHRITDYIIKVCGPNIAMEELKIRNMVKNRKLARAIDESHWGTIKILLDYKCRRAGGQMILVPPMNTSKDCSACGYRKANLQRSERHFECDECGFGTHRDLKRIVEHRKPGIGSPGRGRARVRSWSGRVYFVRWPRRCRQLGSEGLHRLRDDADGVN